MLIRAKHALGQNSMQTTKEHDGTTWKPLSSDLWHMVINLLFLLFLCILQVLIMG